MVERREIWLCIVFSILTCGIYQLYWYYKIIDDLYVLNGEPSRAGMDLLFSILTCGIYYIYMNYKMGDMEERIRQARNTRSQDNRFLYLFLCFFGLSLINYAIMQSNLNDEFGNYIDKRYHN